MDILLQQIAESYLLAHALLSKLIWPWHQRSWMDTGRINNLTSIINTNAGARDNPSLKTVSQQVTLTSTLTHLMSIWTHWDICLCHSRLSEAAASLLLPRWVAVFADCLCLLIWGPIFEKSYTELMKNLWQSLTYEQFRMSMWFSKKSYEKLTTKLCKTYDETYDDIIVILRKPKIHGKWCHSGNPLSEAVIGRILWAKNNWQPEWWFPKNAFEKWLIIFLRKSWEVVSHWLMKDLWKS